MQILILSYIVALVSIFGFITAIYVAANSTGKTVGKPKETPIPDINALVVIDGGNDENQIEIGKDLKVLVTINFPDKEETVTSIINGFKVSLIDENNSNEPIYSKNLGTKCGIFFKEISPPNELIDECDFTYKIKEQDKDKIVKAKVDFLNSDGKVISTIYSTTGKTVIAAENKLSNTNTIVYYVIGTIAIMICVYVIVYAKYKWQNITFGLIATFIGISLTFSFIYNKSPKDSVANGIFAIIGTPTIAFLSR